MPEMIATYPQAAAGRALVVGTPERRCCAATAIEAEGLLAVEVDDPYAAMAELCRMPGRGSAEYSVLILSLQGIYREELQIIAAVRRRFPSMDIWLADIDGRSAALAEAMRLGVNGLLVEDGLHRLSDGAMPAADEAADRVSPLSTPVVPRDAAQGEGPSSEPSRPERLAKSDCSSGHLAELPGDDLGGPYGWSAGEPILTAEELRALLHEGSDVERMTTDR